jgi:hypothetical protein
MGDNFNLHKKKLIEKLNLKFHLQGVLLRQQLQNSIQSILHKNIIPSRKSIQINKMVLEHKSKLQVLKNQKLNALKNIHALKKPQKPQKPQNKIPQPAPIITDNFKSRKALLVGCNYEGTRYQLNGCVNDTANMKSLLEEHKFTDIKILTDNEPIVPNKENILNELKNLLINSSSGDLLCFLYSGHGSYMRDNNNDELDKRDEVIIPLDLKPIKDDELRNVINIYLKKDVTLFALFDSCYSGTVLDLKYQFLDSLNYNTLTVNNKVTNTLGNVVMISGCTDNQTSVDATFNDIWQGALCYTFMETLKANPSVSWRGLVTNMRKVLKEMKYRQIPQLSTGRIINIDVPVFL